MVFSQFYLKQILITIVYVFKNTVLLGFDTGDASKIVWNGHMYF